MALAIDGRTYEGYQKSLNKTQGKLEPFNSMFSDDKGMKDRKRRLASFLLWPVWGKADPEKLADSGFFFTGDEDKVKCFECETEISNWKNVKESPMDVHKRASPACPIVLQYEASAGAVGGTGKSSKKGSKNRRRKHHSGENEDSLSDDGVDTGATPLLKPMNPSTIPPSNPAHALQPRVQTPPSKSAVVDYTLPKDMKDENERLKTFTDWPSDAPVKPPQLVKAGFYYLGPHDRVMCAWCKGRLLNWVPGDDPVGEHARHFPSCVFIQELNNEPLRVLRSKSARALLRLGHSEDLVLMAINQCKIDGNELTVDNIMEEIFKLEDEKAAEQKNLDSFPPSSGLSGLKSLNTEDIMGEEDLDSNMSAKEEVQELKKRNEELKKSTTCKVCLEKDVNIVFLPCRHLVCCASCGGKVEYCPVCRQHIIGTVKTFMA